jgi:hypothetical protein
VHIMLETACCRSECDKITHLFHKRDVCSKSINVLEPYIVTKLSMLTNTSPIIPERLL